MFFRFRIRELLAESSKEQLADRHQNVGCILTVYSITCQHEKTATNDLGNALVPGVGHTRHTEVGIL